MRAILCPFVLLLLALLLGCQGQKGQQGPSGSMGEPGDSINPEAVANELLDSLTFRQQIIDALRNDPTLLEELQGEPGPPGDASPDEIARNLAEDQDFRATIIDVLVTEHADELRGAVGMQGPPGPPGPQGDPGIGADTRCPHVPFTDCPDGSFQNTSLVQTQLWGSNLSGADFSGSYLGAVEWSQDGFNPANLQGVDFTGAFISVNRFTNIDLTGAVFDDSLLDAPQFFQGDLTEASFVGVTSVNGIRFSAADLTRADLTDADLTGANFTPFGSNTTTIDQTDFTGANLTDANLSGTDFSTAIVDDVTWSNTTCPDGTNSRFNSGTCEGHLGL